MFFYGYGPLLWQGTKLTIVLALFSMLVAFVIGLIGAGAKLSQNRALRWVATSYTTIIRGIPDLVLMLLLFYSGQIWLNELTEWMGMEQITIDPFMAGVITIGFIYGAYFTETFRGAFLSVPKGQLEAGQAFGMSSWQVFHRVLFPQMMRFALPGIGNNWQVLLKSTALVSIIGLADVVKLASDAGKATFNMFFFTLVAGGIYLILTTLSNFILMRLERKYSAGVRGAEL
ncbi:histidine ABC transporter permease HisQ [Leeia sp. TBRC 13508]|uniref:Histidine ABC transporter permease HisQ n=1 Tax=Leeia speluncae TaxID=2884804 RepID=A0ABS8D9N2_9NEIS|nr:histidine ABC transporter permease HisQ [Leeia speluncae]MCB6184832.1 histidine ABC transporter permease HisQ [Leeia speluncae]